MDQITYVTYVKGYSRWLTLLPWILLLTTGLAFAVDYDAISLKFTITAPIAVSLLFNTFPFYSANTLLGFELQDYYSATNFLAPNAVSCCLRSNRNI